MKRIELHAKSKFSMDYKSTIDIKNLILKCVENEERGVAIVDSGSIIGLIKAEKILKDLNIKDFKLVYGVEIIVRDREFMNDCKVVVLLKNKKGIKSLYRELSYYSANGWMMMDSLIRIKDNLVLGLIYDENNFDDKLLQYFDYVEVDKSVSREVIDELKKKTMVIYSNRINALSNEEELSLQVLYNQLKIKEQVEIRIYQNTEEILNEIKDKTIVIDNPNKIFNMIERFELIDDEMVMPVNDGFDIDLLVYIKLQERYGDNIPSRIKKRVDEELELIRDLKYDGFINIYKEIVSRCREMGEEYVIEDYISYLYIAYLLGITHFNPIKRGLEYDMFFSHHPSICLKVSSSFYKDLVNFIKNDLKIKMIKVRSFMRLNGIMVNKAIERYEDDNKIKLSLDDKTKVMKYLDDYPINNNSMTFKEIVIPDEFDILTITPYKAIVDTENLYQKCTSIDYRDIKNMFLIIEILPNEDIKKLKELKELTGDKIIGCNYKDKKIISTKEYQSYLNGYKNCLILDEVYDELINSDIELPEVFNIINEIRKDKVISKKTKEILKKNNIKLKKFHDIRFISRGIFNERIRLVYELLYFKVYYPLDYYYVMLRDCSFNDVIEIIIKGYDEIIRRINDYKEYRYEYTVLNLVKELYESDIEFKIEERRIVDDFGLEMDKENKKIVLFIRKRSSLIKKYLSYDLSLVGTRPMNGKMMFLSKIVCDLLNGKEKITLFGFDGNVNYYLEYILSNIIGIDRKIIHQYLNPCACYVREIFSIDSEKYIEGIKYLFRNDLFIRDYHMVSDIIIEGVDTLLEKIRYMIKEERSKVIIIDRLEFIDDDLEKILKELKKISEEREIKFIIFTNLKREYEVEKKYDMSSFENSFLLDKYIDYISILDGKELVCVKELLWED